MKEIWTKERAAYHGEFVNFDPMVARPKPVQKPHPPIHVGGAFPHGARRAIRYGDGWIPGGDIREVLPKFREMARDAGRDPASIEITSFALGEDPDRVKRLAEMGIARVVPMFPPEKADTVLPIAEPGKKSPSGRRRRCRQPDRGRFEREAGCAGSGGFGYGAARRTSAAGLSSRRPS